VDEGFGCEDLALFDLQGCDVRELQGTRLIICVGLWLVVLGFGFLFLQSHCCSALLLHWFLNRRTRYSPYTTPFKFCKS
jgi:hypothetical protein